MATNNRKKHACGRFSIVGSPRGRHLMGDSRSKRPHLFGSALRSKPQIVRTARDEAAKKEALAVMRGSLAKAGLDLDRFDERRRRSRTDLQAAQARFLAASEERIPAMTQDVVRSAEHWRRANGIRTGAAPSSGVYAVHTAEEILANDLDLRSQQMAPWGNSAQVVLDVSTSDIDSVDGSVVFVFRWQNATGQDALCTVTGLVGVTATTDATADSYWFPLDPTPPASRLDAYAALGLAIVGADGQVTYPAYQDTQVQDVVHLVVHGDWTAGTIVGEDIFRGYVLQSTGLFLPATSRFEIYLTCEVSWLANDGGAQFIAAGAGRQISGFGAIISTQPVI